MDRVIFTGDGGSRLQSGSLSSFIPLVRAIARYQPQARRPLREYLQEMLLCKFCHEKLIRHSVNFETMCVMIHLIIYYCIFLVNCWDNIYTYKIWEKADRKFLNGNTVKRWPLKITPKGPECGVPKLRGCC